jgi:alpha-1,2-mannosyltransferase
MTQRQAQPSLIAHHGAALLLSLLSLIALSGAVATWLGDTRTLPLEWLGKPFHDAGDSWNAMRHAWIHVQKFGPGALYELALSGTKFQYPPSSLLIFDGLNYFGLQLTNSGFNGANALFLAVNIAATFFIYRAATDGFNTTPGRPDERPVVTGFIFAALAAVHYPLNKAFDLGQLQVLCNLLFALAVLVALRDYRLLAGCLIGGICLLKPQFLLFGIWAILRGQYRFLAGFCAVGAVGAAASIALYGLATHFEYLKLLSVLSRLGESYAANQSINGLMHRLLFNGNNTYFSPDQFAPYHPIVHGATLISSALIIGCALFLIRRTHRRESQILDLSIAGLSFAIASPIAWEHHYGILVAIYPVLFCSLRNIQDPDSRKIAMVIFTAAVIMSAFYVQIWRPLAGTYLNFLQSMIFFGGIVILFLLHWRWRAASRLALEDRMQA